MDRDSTQFDENEMVAGINHMNVDINFHIINTFGFSWVFQNVVPTMIPIETEMAVCPTLSILNYLLIEIFEGYLFRTITFLSFAK